jgi:signal peptidase II
MKIKIIRSVMIFVVLAACIGCDQVSKHYVRETIGYDEQISLIKDVLTLTKVENSGAFLSLGDTLPDSVRFIVLSLLPLVILGFGLGLLIMKTSLSKRVVLGFAFVIGGGIGNIYDRLIYGSVTDFLHIDLGPVQTGVFNVADVLILAGLFIVLMDSLKKENLSANSSN